MQQFPRYKTLGGRVAHATCLRRRTPSSVLASSALVSVDGMTNTLAIVPG